MNNVSIYCDATFRSDVYERPAWAGFIVFNENKIEHQEARKVPAGSSLEAEMRAVLLAISWMKSRKVKNTIIFTDNKSIPLRLQNGKKYNTFIYQELITKIKNEIKNLGDVKIQWLHCKKSKIKIVHKLCNEAAKRDKSNFIL